MTKDGRQSDQSAEQWSEGGRGPAPGSGGRGGVPKEAGRREVRRETPYWPLTRRGIPKNYQGRDNKIRASDQAALSATPSSLEIRFNSQEHMQAFIKRSTC